MKILKSIFETVVSELGANMKAPKNGISLENIFKVQVMGPEQAKVIGILKSGSTYIKTLDILEGVPESAYYVNINHVKKVVKLIKGEFLTFGENISDGVTSIGLTKPEDDIIDALKIQSCETGDPVLSLHTRDFTEALKKLSPLCASDDLRPVMCGVHFAFNKDKDSVVIAASDGHYIGVQLMPEALADESLSLILSSGICNEIVKILTTGFVEVYALGGQYADRYIISTEDKSLIVYGTSGRYPNVFSVIPTSPGSSELKFNVTEMLEAVEMELSIMGKDSNGHMRFTPKEGKVLAESEAYFRDPEYFPELKNLIENSSYTSDFEFGLSAPLLKVLIKSMYLGCSKKDLENETLTITYRDPGRVLILSRDKDPIIWGLMPTVLTQPEV